MKRLRTSFVPLVVGAVVLAALLPCSASAANSPTRPITWYAAGDSYSSGQGLPYRAGSCARAYNQGVPGELGAWGLQAADVLQSQGAVTLAPGSPHLIACTGATTAEMYNEPGETGAEWPLGARTDLLTFTFGGDDVGFKKIIEDCLGIGSITEIASAGLIASTSWDDPVAAEQEWAHDPAISCPSNALLRNRIATDIGSGPMSQYVGFLLWIAETSMVSGGNVVVLGYPQIVTDPSAWPLVNRVLGTCQGIDESGARELRGLDGDLNATIAEAVAEANRLVMNKVHFTFVDVNSPNPAEGIRANDPDLFDAPGTSGHALCSGSQWITGISPRHPTASFHPDEAGNDAMAGLLETVFHHLNWSSLGPAPDPIQLTGCPTSYGIFPSPTSHLPSAAAATIESTSNGGYEIYSTGDGSFFELAPSGWSCSAAVGADGGTGITASSPDGDWVGVSYVPACVGCIYDMVCPYFSTLQPAALARISFGGYQCTTSPPEETVTELNRDVVLVEDPPGVNGTFNNSNGTTALWSVVVFATQWPGMFSSGSASCYLPESGDADCALLLRDFVARLGISVGAFST